MSTQDFPDVPRDIDKFHIHVHFIYSYPFLFHIADLSIYIRSIYIFQQLLLSLRSSHSMPQSPIHYYVCPKRSFE